MGSWVAAGLACTGGVWASCTAPPKLREATSVAALVLAPAGVESAGVLTVRQVRKPFALGVLFTVPGVCWHQRDNRVAVDGAGDGTCKLG
jgi:hypothetical protein